MRYLSLTTRDMYRDFKRMNPEAVVGFSKFASLRHKWCLPISAPGAHNICVCTIHQNVKLLVDKIGKIKAANGDESVITYREIFDKIVCKRENRDCMVHRCHACPGVEKLREFLNEIMVDENSGDDETITF